MKEIFYINKMLLDQIKINEKNLKEVEKLFKREVKNEIK